MFCFVQLKLFGNTRGISQHVFKSWLQKTCYRPSDLHARSTIKILVAKYQIQISHLFSIQAHMPLPSPLSSTLSLCLPLLRGAQSQLLHCNQSLFCPRCNLIAPACRPCKISERKTWIWLGSAWALSVALSQTTLIGSRCRRAVSHATLGGLRLAWESWGREMDGLGKRYCCDGKGALKCRRGPCPFLNIPIPLWVALNAGFFMHFMLMQQVTMPQVISCTRIQMSHNHPNKVQNFSICHF